MRTRRICAVIMAIAMIFTMSACAKETPELEQNNNTGISITENGEVAGIGAETEVRETETEVSRENSDKVTDETGEDDMLFKKQIKEAPATGEVAGISYEIHGNYDYHYKSAEKGYLKDSFNKAGSGIYYIISSGKRPSGGYKIIVTDIKAVNDTTVEITVAETAPGANDIVTMAVTYPMCAVSFDREPENVIIKDNLGNNYDYIDNTK